MTSNTVKTDVPPKRRERKKSESVLSISSASHWKLTFLVISFSTVFVAAGKVKVKVTEHDMSFLTYLDRLTWATDGGQSPGDEHLVSDL